MASRRGKRAAFWVASIGLGVLLLAGAMLKDALYARYLTWRLEVGDLDEKWWAARRICRLGGDRSRLSEDWLIERLRTGAVAPQGRSDEAVSLLAGIRSEKAIRALAQAARRGSTPAEKALVPLGEPGVLPILEAFCGDGAAGFTDRGEALVGEMGPDAVPALAHVLGSDDARFDRSALHILGRIGPGAAPALPEILTALTKATTWELKGSTAFALGGIGGEEAVDALISLVLEPEPEVQRRASWALARIGPPAEKAVESLALILDSAASGDPTLGADLVSALFSIGSPSARDVLGKALDHPSPEVRAVAASALGAMGARARDWLDRLLEKASDADPRVSAAAARAMERIRNDMALQRDLRRATPR